MTEAAERLTIAVVLRTDVHAGEVTGALRLCGQPAPYLGPDLLDMQPFSLVLGSAGDVGLLVVPVRSPHEGNHNSKIDGGAGVRQ